MKPLLFWLRLNSGSALRWFIALLVIGVTLVMTMKTSSVSSEWEAVFLAVIGYYFKDRPAEEHYTLAGDQRSLQQMTSETTFQWALAALLIVGTFLAFVSPNYKSSISGGWIGAVVLAIGFYFKDIGSGGKEIVQRHQLFRALLALGVTALTPGFFLLEWRRNQDLQIPLQWIGIVFIVVTFYFKERRPTDSNGSTNLAGMSTKMPSEG